MPNNKKNKKKKKNKTDLMRISGAAESAGVTKQVIEYYIMLGLVTPIRIEGRYGRFFDAKLVRRIRLIRKLNRSGYTLRSIGQTYLRGK